MHRCIEFSTGRTDQLWQQNSKAEAFKLILSTLQTTITQLTLQLPILEQLKEKVKAASFDMDNIENRLTALENRDCAKDKAIKLLQQERDQALVSKALVPAASYHCLSQTMQTTLWNSHKKSKCAGLLQGSF